MDLARDGEHLESSRVSCLRRTRSANATHVIINRPNFTPPARLRLPVLLPDDFVLCIYVAHHHHRITTVFGSRCAVSVHNRIRCLVPLRHLPHRSWNTASKRAQRQVTPVGTRLQAACRRVSKFHENHDASRNQQPQGSPLISRNAAHPTSLSSQLDSSPFSRVPAIGSFLHRRPCTMTVFPTVSGGARVVPCLLPLTMGADDEACFVPFHCLL